MDAELHSLARLLQSFTIPRSIRQGKQLHSIFFKKGVLNSTVSLANRILQMYSRCGNLADAHNLFDEMSDRNCFSWNTMIEGYMKAGEKAKSLELFDSMPCKNDYSWNVVVSGSAKFGDVATARKLFEQMPRKDCVASNSVIHGYVRNGRHNEAVRLFRALSMDPCEEESSIDGFVLATVIGACADLGAVNCGKQIHGRILSDGVEFDAVMASSLTNLYAKCGDFDSASFVLNTMGDDPDDFSLSALVSGYAGVGRFDDARRLLDRTSNCSTVVWNSLISNRDGREAVECFGEMRRRGIRVDSSTIASILSAWITFGIGKRDLVQIHAYSCKIGLINDVVVCCAIIDAYSKSGNADDACELFREIEVFDTVLLNSMITVYSNCGRIEDSKHIFRTMPCKSLISWNSMVVALSKNGCSIEALDTFREMNRLGLRSDEFSLASVVSACAAVSSVELGEQVFARATAIGLDSDPAVSASLVDFYCKCGFIETGRKIFDSAAKLDPVCWNSMLMGYSTNGQGSEALALFDTMTRHCFVSPSNITFTAVLSACDHCGLVEEGWKWFREMKYRYYIDPGIEHYSCMIDLFARAGRIEEAMSLITDHMPFEPDATMWSSVLRGCVVHGDDKLGAKVAQRIIELDPENAASAYIQLSGMFAKSGNWESSSLIRNSMQENRVKKLPGYSWG